MRIVRKMSKVTNGFTLIEILVVIGIIAVLASIVIIAINPARQFAQARNAQRISNVNAILNAIGQRIADNKGLFREATDTVCTATMDIPATAVDEGTSVEISEAGLNFRPCLVPTYISELSVDPKEGSNDCDATCSGATTYNTKYKIYKNANGRVTVWAPVAGSETAISTTPPAITVTR